jgi:hypothetical protein
LFNKVPRLHFAVDALQPLQPPGDFETIGTLDAHLRTEDYGLFKPKLTGGWIEQVIGKRKLSITKCVREADVHNVQRPFLGHQHTLGRRLDSMGCNERAVGTFGMMRLTSRRNRWLHALATNLLRKSVSVS